MCTDLGVVLVGQRGERDGRELAALQPVHGGRVDRHRFLGADVRAVLRYVIHTNKQRPRRKRQRMSNARREGGVRISLQTSPGG